MSLKEPPMVRDLLNDFILLITYLYPPSGVEKHNLLNILIV